MTKRKPETQRRRARSDIKIDKVKIPIVRQFFETMLAQGLGFTAFEHISGITYATIQGWAQGKTPRLPDLAHAASFLGMELWLVQTKPVEHDLRLKAPPLKHRHDAPEKEGDRPTVEQPEESQAD